MLRLKGERDDDTLDEAELAEHREPLAHSSDEITSADAFPADRPDNEAYDVEGEDDEEEERWSILPLRGLGIAAATFVPTFLGVFFGLPYLLDSATTARTPSPPVAATAPLKSESAPEVTPSLSETLRRGSTDRPTEALAVTPRVFDQPASRELDALQRDASRRDPGVEPAPRALEAAPVASAPAQAPAPTLPAPTLPPVQAGVSEPPRPVVARPASEPRPAAEPRAAPGARKPSEWTPAAAFADREAAGRLAGSIEKQGYPVEIRQDGSSSRPWVVWIGAQPSGARRR
jgi:hypothetical protein